VRARTSQVLCTYLKKAWSSVYAEGHSIRLKTRKFDDFEGCLVQDWSDRFLLIYKSKDETYSEWWKINEIKSLENP